VLKHQFSSERSTVRVTTHIAIDAEAHEVWQIVGPGFGRVSDWATTVAESMLVGEGHRDGAPFSGRACTIAEAGFDQLTEEILTYEPSSFRLSYRASSGMPSVVDKAINTWSVADDGRQGSVFTMDAEVDVSRRARFLGPAVGIYLGMFARRTSKDLKVYAETGEVSTAKRMRRSRRKPTALDRLVTANSAFSALCGTALAGLSNYWSGQFGGAGAELFLFLGVGLLMFSAVIAGIAGRGASPLAGKTIAAVDSGWVAGTVALLFVAGGQFTVVGLIAAIGAGAAVGMFAWAQYRAASRLADSPGAALRRMDIS